jgi:clan AA aspartic protease (TIGR02281 family)
MPAMSTDDLRPRSRIFLDTGRGPPTCRYHPAAPASAICSECLEALCDLCRTVLPGLTIACPSCRGRVLTRRRAVRATAVCGGVAAVAVLLPLAVRQSHVPVPPPASTEQPAARDDPEADRLREAVAAEPCDRARILHLANKLVEKDENREAVNVATRFLFQCGEHPELRGVVYEAHRRLGQWDGAIAEASKLIETDRHDRDYWGWRGLAYEAKGDLASAISDYQQVLRLEPRMNGIPFNLAALHERTGHPCEAIFPLEQFLHYHPDLQDVGQLRQRIIALYDSGTCGDYAARGRAVIAVGGTDESIVTVATVNGGHRGRFIVDTGASYVALSPRFARLISLAVNHTSVLVQTANGPVTAEPVVLDEVAVQGARASRVSALVMDTLPHQIDGLLGLSFLSRFDVTMNPRHRRLELNASRRAGSH